MAKYYGAIGFALTEEDPPNSGNWIPKIIERKYYGDVLRRNIHNQNGEKVNDDLAIDNEISVVADSFLFENTHAMKYITYLGTKWKIRTISTAFPRLTLTIGGVYNGTYGPREETLSSQVT